MNKNNKLIDGFLETIYAERNASKNTLLAYKRDLVAFTNFLSKKNIDLYKTNRKDIENDIKKLRMSDIIKTILLMVIGTILGYVSDIGLKHHTPESLGIIDLIISFVFSGITFYFFSGEKYTIYSVIAYVLTIILAILSQTI